MATKITTKKGKKKGSKVRKTGTRIKAAPLSLDYVSSGTTAKDHRETFVIPYQQLEVTTNNTSDSIILETKLTPVTFASTRLEIMSRCYELFRINRASFKFRSNLAMTESGTIILAYLADPMDGATLGSTAAMSILGNYKNVMGRVTEPLSLNLGPKDLTKTVPWFQVEPNSTDLRLSQQGKLEVGYVGSVAANRVLGTLFLVFDITFSRPCIPVTGPTGIETTQETYSNDDFAMPTATETPMKTTTALAKGGSALIQNIVDGVGHYYLDGLYTIGRQILSASLVAAGGIAAHLLNIRATLRNVQTEPLDAPCSPYNGMISLSIFFSHTDFGAAEPALLDPTYIITDEYYPYSTGTYELFGHQRPYIAVNVATVPVLAVMDAYFSMMFSLINSHEVTMIPCIWQNSGNTLHLLSSGTGRSELRFNVHNNLLKQSVWTSSKANINSSNGFVVIGPRNDDRVREKTVCSVTESVTSRVAPSFPIIKPKLK